MRSPRFREGFAKHGIEAAGPRATNARNEIVELIRKLQLGKHEGTAKRLGEIAKVSFQSRLRKPLVVCLACTELPLAFEEHNLLATFEHDGVLYINSIVAHIDAAFQFAINEGVHQK